MPDDEIDDKNLEEQTTKLILKKLKEVQLTELTSDELDTIVEEIKNINKNFSIPKLDYTERDGKEYVVVLWEDPEGADLKSYEVNDHLVYAGCSFGDKLKRGGKMVCKEKELYMVLHPKDEWESYHIRNLKA